MVGLASRLRSALVRNDFSSISPLLWEVNVLGRFKCDENLEKVVKGFLTTFSWVFLQGNYPG